MGDSWRIEDRLSKEEEKEELQEEKNKRDSFLLKEV